MNIVSHVDLNSLSKHYLASSTTHSLLLFLSCLSVPYWLFGDRNFCIYRSAALNILIFLGYIAANVAVMSFIVSLLGLICIYIRTGTCMMCICFEILLIGLNYIYNLQQ